MLIAAIGLYGVMSYTVTRRRVEIGIRMALGADARAVIRMVLAESGTLLVVGLTIGVAVAGIASRYARSLLYGLKPLDPISFVVGISALAFVSVCAAWIPAVRPGLPLPQRCGSKSHPVIRDGNGADGGNGITAEKQRNGDKTEKVSLFSARLCCSVSLCFYRLLRLLRLLSLAEPSRRRLTRRAPPCYTSAP